MPSVVRRTDMSTGHGGFPPRPNFGASADTYIENLGAHRVADGWAVHCDSHSCHGAVLASGSPNTYVNGLAVGRTGDVISCGSFCATGASTVFAN